MAAGIGWALGKLAMKAIKNRIEIVTLAIANYAFAQKLRRYLNAEGSPWMRFADSATEPGFKPMW